MASKIRIKRSGVAGNPSTLGAGELAYSWLPDNGSNGGDRLYIGAGTETNGNAENHVVIGGKYFTDLLDHNKGVLTPSSAIIVDEFSKIDVLNVDNITIDGNTISSSNVNGNITLNPNGDGAVEVVSPATISAGSNAINVFEVLDSVGVGLFEVRQNGDAIIGGILTVNGTGSSSFTGSVDIELLDVDNIRIDGNTISSTNTDGDIIFNPNGNGAVSVVSPVAIGDGSESVNIFEVLDSVGTGLFEVRQNGDAVIGGVLTVNGDGTSTFSGSVDIGGNLTVDGDATVNADLSSDNLTLTGNLVVHGNTTLGFADATEVDLLTIVARVDSNIIPNVNSNYNLGSSDLRWGTVWTSTLNSGNISITSNTISSTNTDGDIILDPNGAGEVSVSNARIINVAAPIDDTDAANKYYVDAARSGLDIKESVRTATVSNINLASPPVDSAGDFIIDGVSLTAGDRLLVKNQTNATQNGIYVVGGNSGSGWTLTRAPDMDENTEISGGTFAFVEEGTVNADTGFVVTSNGNLTLGVNDIEWTLFSTSGTLVAGDGLSKDGYTLKVNTAAAGGLEIVSDELQLKSTVAGNGLTYTNGVIDVVGTANRITVNANNIDIASTYAGQTSITTLGTITTGTWNGSVIADAYVADNLTINAGTINNTPIGASIANSGAFTTLTASGEVSFDLTTDLTVSTGSVTAAVVMAGGLAVAKSVYVGDNLVGSGVDTSSIDGFTIDGGTY